MARPWFEDDDEGIVVGAVVGGVLIVGHPGDGINDACTAHFGGLVGRELTEAAKEAGRLVQITDGGFLGEPEQ